MPVDLQIRALATRWLSGIFQRRGFSDPHGVERRSQPFFASVMFCEADSPEVCVRGAPGSREVPCSPQEAGALRRRAPRARRLSGRESTGEDCRSLFDGVGDGITVAVSSTSVLGVQEGATVVGGFPSGRLWKDVGGLTGPGCALSRTGSTAAKQGEQESAPVCWRSGAAGPAGATVAAGGPEAQQVFIS